MLLMWVTITGTLDALDGVMDRDRGVGEAARIENHAKDIAAPACWIQLDDIALVVRLPEIDGEAMRLRRSFAQSFSTSFRLERP